MNERARIDRVRQKFEDLCREAGWWVSPDGRIGAATVEHLLGWKAGAFASRSLQGAAPRAYRIGGGGHKLTVELEDLAAWYCAQVATDCNEQP